MSFLARETASAAGVVSGPTPAQPLTVGQVSADVQDSAMPRQPVG